MNTPTTRLRAAGPAVLAHLDAHREHRVRRSWAQKVPLADIDREDQRFQHRAVVSVDDLVESLRHQGQLTPVVLWGQAAPYIVIDGFRRIGALSELGGDDVDAVVEADLDEQAAYARSFSENVRRRSLSAHDRAHAIQRALERWGLDKRDLAGLLGLSVRQVDRYLALLQFDDKIQAALAAKHITMAQAVILHRCAPSDLDHWIDEIQTSELSTDELTRSLRRRGPHRARPYLTRDPRGFRMRAVRYREDMGPGEKRKIWEALERGLRVIAQSSGGRPEGREGSDG